MNTGKVETLLTALIVLVAIAIIETGVLMYMLTRTNIFLGF